MASGPTEAEFQALLAAQRTTAAQVEALMLRVAHLEGGMVRLGRVAQDLTRQLAALRDAD